MGHHIAVGNHPLGWTEETRYYPMPILVKGNKHQNPMIRKKGKLTGIEPHRTSRPPRKGVCTLDGAPPKRSRVFTRSACRLPVVAQKPPILPMGGWWKKEKPPILPVGGWWKRCWCVGGRSRSRSRTCGGHRQQQQQKQSQELDQGQEQKLMQR